MLATQADLTEVPITLILRRLCHAFPLTDWLTNNQPRKYWSMHYGWGKRPSSPLPWLPVHSSYTLILFFIPGAFPCFLPGFLYLFIMQALPQAAALHPAAPIWPLSSFNHGSFIQRLSILSRFLPCRSIPPSSIFQGMLSFYSFWGIFIGSKLTRLQASPQYERTIAHPCVVMKAPYQL